MKNSLKLKTSITLLFTFVGFMVFMWDNSFFLTLEPEVRIANDKKEPRNELTTKIFDQLDYLVNLDDSPSYLFKYNLAKIVFLFSYDTPTSLDLVNFKEDLEYKSLNEFIMSGIQIEIFTDFDAILLSKMYDNIITKNDYYLQEINIKSKVLEQNLMSNHIAKSYLNFIEKENMINAGTQKISSCSRCISFCMNTYSFSTNWWQNYKKVLNKRVNDGKSKKDHHHAYFFAESSGLSSCENEVCKSSCNERCEDCVPSFVYQEV